VTERTGALFFIPGSHHSGLGLGMMTHCGSVVSGPSLVQTKSLRQRDPADALMRSSIDGYGWTMHIDEDGLCKEIMVDGRRFRLCGTYSIRYLGPVFVIWNPMAVFPFLFPSAFLFSFLAITGTFTVVAPRPRRGVRTSRWLVSHLPKPSS